jgi:hypothetical protein
MFVPHSAKTCFQSPVDELSVVSTPVWAYNSPEKPSAAVPAVLRIMVISSVIASVTNAGSVEISGYSDGSGVGVGAGGLGLSGKIKLLSLPAQLNITMDKSAIIKKRNVFIVVCVSKKLILFP